jgi:hypothetical protein
MPSNDTVFICSCDERLETTDDVDRHDKSWFDLGHDKQCRYPGCTTISPQTSNAKRHWRTHLPKRLGKYFCPKCDASYVKPEHLKKHQAAVDCRKNRKRCRSASEHDPAPLSPPALRQTATSFLDPQADDRSPPHPEKTSNDTGQLSASSTATHAAEWNSVPSKISPSLSQYAPYPYQGSFTIDTPQNIHQFPGQKDPIMLPTDRQGIILEVTICGMWESLANFYEDAMRVGTWDTPWPHLESSWKVIVGCMMKGQHKMLDSMFITHAESLTDGMSSDWSINLEWSDHQITGQWKFLSGRRSIGRPLEINGIFVADEKFGAAVLYDSLARKRYLSESHGDPALPVPSITSRNDMSLPDGHAAESQPPSEVPSNDTSQPFTATASSPATGSADSTRPNHPFRWPTPHRNLVDEQSRTDNITRSGSPPSALCSPVTHGSSLLSATPLQDVSNMSRPRGTSESLDPSSAAYPQGDGTEWLGMGASYRVHQKSPSDQLPGIFSAHNPPYMQKVGSSDRSSSMLDPSASADPAFSEGLGLGHFSLNDQSRNFYSPGHSPATSPNDGIRQQQQEETAQAEDAQHRSQREPTRPIPPKAALVDYTAAEQRSLFRDPFPKQYKQHFGSTEQFPANFLEFLQCTPRFWSPKQVHDFFSRDTKKSDPNFSKQGDASSLGPNGSGVAPTENRLPSASREYSMSDNPGPLSQEGDGFLNIQRPDDTRANTGTYTCTYHGCTQRFESQPALQRHKRDFHDSQAHDAEDSGAESGAASVSPRPHTRPGLRRYSTPVLCALGHEECFPIDISQADITTKPAGRESFSLCVTLEGSWPTVRSFLNAFPTELYFNTSDERPVLTSLWRAMVEAMAIGPPDMLEDIFSLHLQDGVTVYGSVWLIEFEWTEEKIVGHWKLDAGPVNLRARYEYRGITVVGL